jgi:hypothetical protein
MVDEFLAKASISQCSSFAETAEVISKVGFKMFLGVNVEVRQPCHLPPAISTPASYLLRYRQCQSEVELQLSSGTGGGCERV